MTAEQTRDFRAEKRFWRREVADDNKKTKEKWVDRVTAPVIRGFFKSIQYAFGLLPLATALEIGAMGGLAAYYLLIRRRRVALENLRLAFGSDPKNTLTEADYRFIAKRTFQNFGRTFIEFLRFNIMTKRDIERRVRTSGMDNLRAVLDKGQGALAVSAHLGNFEMIAASTNLLGICRNSLMGRKIKPPVVDSLVVDLRKQCDVTTIYSKEGLKQVLRTLRRNEGVGIVLDQNMRRGIGIFVNFFGIAASTTPGLALLALRKKGGVLPSFCVREGLNGHHHLFVLPPVPIAKTGDRDHDLKLNTQRFTKIVEAVVRRWPDQWFWFHQRWRVRPADESQPGPVEEIPDDWEYMDTAEALLDRYLKESKKPQHIATGELS